MCKEHRMGFLENKEFRKIFGPKREEVTGGWRKWHIKELFEFCFSSNITRMNKLKWISSVQRVTFMVWWVNLKETANVGRLEW